MKLSTSVIRKLIKEELDNLVARQSDSPQSITRKLSAGIKQGETAVSTSNKGEVLIYPLGAFGNEVLILKPDGSWIAKGFMGEGAVKDLPAELRAAQEMAEEEAGPKKVKKMKDYEDGIHTGVSSLVDIFDEEED